MLFSSLTFLFVFLPLFLVVYYLLPNKTFVKNGWFLLASLAFYFFGEQEFINLLLVSIVINFICGLIIDSANESSKKLALGTGVTANLLILLYFKYSSFLINSINPDYLHFASYALPLGISFFTFQSISYLVDIFRKDAPASKNIFNVALYISMFPQLVAGPIVRYAQIDEQIKNRQLKQAEISYGILLFLIGLSYKILIADHLGKMVDGIYGLPLDQITTPLAWAATLGYTFQIYFDFGGYSTMAVGLGLMLGFRFPHNFNFPHLAESITMFWRRWHITLSEWFRDYLYFPLGGNKKGNGRTLFNLFIVFALCGIWHGASWNFMIWGLFHGLFLIIERLGFNKVLKKFPKFIRIGYAFIIVLIGLVIFRGTSFSQTTTFWLALIGIEPTAPTKYWHYSEFINAFTICAFIMAILFSTTIVNRLFFKNETGTYSTLSSFSQLPVGKYNTLFVGFVFIGFIFSVLFMVNQSYNPFIYFRF